MVPHHCHLHFPDNMGWNSFPQAWVPSVYLLQGELYVKVFDPDLNQVVFLLSNFKSYLYILGNSPLSAMLIISSNTMS